MNKIDVGGLRINAVTKKQLLDEVVRRINGGQKTFITTPYSEFLYSGLKDAKVMEMLNQADLAVSDGIGIFWAKRFLDLPLTFKNYWLKILQALWQIFYSLLAIIFYPKWIKSVLPEKIVGANLIWDLARLANDNRWSIYLLGGFGETPKLAADTLKAKHPKTKITGWSNKNPNDPALISDIQKANPDLLFVAFGPIKQERWITANLQNLPCKLVIGLGGTFDYLAKKKLEPPKFLRFIGLEWFWRLITQPYRLKRIFHATFGLIWYLLHYKVFTSFPIRKNAVAIILNPQGKVFVARKSPKFHKVDIINDYSLQKWQDYWQFPQGGVEKEENLIEGIRREIKEETGIRSLQFLKISNRSHTYIWNNALRRFWHNRNYCFKGQSQNIVYFKFMGSDDEIKLPRHEEFIDYKWVAIKDLNYAVHEERLPVAKIVQEDLKNGLLNATMQ